MIINDLHFRWPCFRPDEANAILIVHANAMLSEPIVLQGFQLVPGWHPEIVKYAS